MNIKIFVFTVLCVSALHAYIFINMGMPKTDTQIIATKKTQPINIKLRKIAMPKKAENKKIPKKIKQIEKSQNTKKLPRATATKKIKQTKKSQNTKKLPQMATPQKSETKHKQATHVEQETKQKIQKIDIATIKRIEDEYLKKIKNAIKQNTIYPRQAKRLKQSGKVVVAFIINEDGLINNISIKSPSKHKRLNKASMDILKTIKQFGKIPKETNRHFWKISIPILYELRG